MNDEGKRDSRRHHLRNHKALEPGEGYLGTRGRRRLCGG